MSLVCQKIPQKQEKKKLLFCCLLHFSKTTSTNKQLQQFIQPCSLFLLILSSFGHNHLIALCFFVFVFFKSLTVRWAPDPTTLKSTACRISPAVIQTDLQDRLNLGRDVGLLIQLDALLVGPSRALCRDPLQVGQYHTVSLGHCLELVKQKLQQFQQQPVEGSRERGRTEMRPALHSFPRQLVSTEVPCVVLFSRYSGLYESLPLCRLVEKVVNCSLWT